VKLRKCEIISHTPSILSNNFFQQFKRLGRRTKREERIGETVIVRRMWKGDVLPHTDAKPLISPLHTVF